MDSPRSKLSDNPWVVVGILVLATALVMLLILRHFRQQSDPEHNYSGLNPPRGGVAQNKSAENNTLTEDSRTSSPGRTVQQLVRAWNQQHSENIGEMFASDGVLIIPTGSQIQSRAEIEKAIVERRAGVLKDTTLSQTVNDVVQPDPDRAIVKGTYQLDGIKIFGFTQSTTGSYVLHQTRRDGRWLISRAEVTKGGEG